MYYEDRRDQTPTCDHLHAITNLQNDFLDVDFFCTMRKDTKQPHPPEYKDNIACHSIFSCASFRRAEEIDRYNTSYYQLSE